MSDFKRLDLKALLVDLRPGFPPGQPVYLVGGAVRDLLLGRPVHDLDFVLPGDALAVSRGFANRLGGAFYPLDEERGAGRVLLDQPDGERMVLDFTSFRGPDLHADLLARDLTINAMALDLDNLEQLIDISGGLQDLRQKRLRAVTAASFSDDPLRIWRTVRQATGLAFSIEAETRRWMRESASQLPRITSERLRDELFRILDGPRPAQAVRVLDVLGAVEPVLPELAALKGVTQSAPHTLDVWNHTLDLLNRLDDVLAVLGLAFDPEAAGAWARGFVAVQLGRFRQQLHEHLDHTLNPNRTHRALLYLAALYHDIGKPGTRQIEADGRIRFFEHERVGAELASRRFRNLQLSNEEVSYATAIVAHHMRPLLLLSSGLPVSRRAIYRLFRDAGSPGIDVCLLSLADALATYGTALPRQQWTDHLEVVRSLFSAWWEQPEQQVAPPPLLNGHELMEALGIPSGRQVGELLELIREAQATGEVADREQALSLVRQTLHRQN